MEQDELIELVKTKNDEEAFKILNEEFTPMMYSIIKNYELKYGDYLIAREDLLQEGSLGLLDACKAYIKNDVTKFSTFAYIVIKRRINKAFYRLVNYYKDEYVSFDKLENIDHLKILSTNAYVSEKEIEYQIDKEKQLEQLLKSKHITEQDKKIIDLRLKGYSYKDIAKLLNINTKRVDNRLTRLKKALKKSNNK